MSEHTLEKLPGRKMKISESILEGARELTDNELDDISGGRGISSTGQYNEESHENFQADFHESGKEGGPF